MLARYAPGMAALFAFLIGSVPTPSLAQLPPTNMGKYVHQPGDNQYTNQTQQERHGQPAPPPQMRFNSAPVALPPTPMPRRPDISLDPIPADEPVPPAGFPPLPDRLDLPIASSGSWSKSSGGGGATWSGGGGGGGAPGMSGAPSQPASPTFHQHYGHMPPGAYVQPQQQGGGGGGAAPGMAGGGGGGHGYYKAVTPSAPAGGGGTGYYKARTPGNEYFNANTGGGAPGTTTPRYTGATSKDLRNLGREPKLNDRQETTQTPDAPQPVVVNQAQTQDLSLPEDEFNYRAPQKSGAGKFGKGALRVIKGPLNSVGGVAGIRF